MLLRNVATLCLVGGVICGSAIPSFAADAANTKDGFALISQMYVKQLTKALTLTEEQQKKAKAICDNEAARMRVIDSKEELDLNQKTELKVAAKKETAEKLKEILTPEQKIQFEVLQAKTSRKKPAPAAPPKP